MAASTPSIYQFKITLKGSYPRIWRRIQVPSTYTFFDMHVTMGWENIHLHQFDMQDSQTGEKITIGKPIPKGQFSYGLDIIPQDQAKIADYFVAIRMKGYYLYDFGDGWNHKVTLEKIFDPEANVKYPRCVAGKRHCPPEDCGGIEGYKELLEILTNPNHEEYNAKIAYLEELNLDDYDPEEFHPDQVTLDLELW